MQPVDDTITIEVKSRLDDLFGETADESLDFMQGQTQDASPLKGLKAALLSLDWEITEDVMSDFVHQVESLKGRFGRDRILALFLQLLGSVGRYVQVYKGRSHPQAFKLLNTTFNRLEEVVAFPDLKEADKKRYLYGEILKFKDLREKIGIESPQPRADRVAAEEGHRQPQPRAERAAAEEGPRQPAPPAGRKVTPPPAAGDRIQPPAEPVPDASPVKAAPGAPAKAKGAPVFFERFEERGGPQSPAPIGEDLRPAAGRPQGDPFPAVFLKGPAEAEGRAPVPAGTPGPDRILAALDEISALIREEFNSLRSQIRSLERSR